MKKIKALIEITRPINIIFTFVVVLVSIILCSEEFNFSLHVILASSSAALVAAAGNVINDFFDSGIDKINRPNRPIPRGVLSKKDAIIYYLLLILIAINIALLVSANALIIVVITSIILFFYSKTFKAIPLVGNIAVSFSTALTFIYGGIIAENIVVAIIPAVFAFLINMVREVLKDIEDIEGDKKNNLSTFPIQYGIKNTSILLLVISLFLLISTFYPFVIGIYKIEYFIIVLFLVNLPLVYLMKETLSRKYLYKISQFSSMLKVVMVFGLFAIYLGLK